MIQSILFLLMLLGGLRAECNFPIPASIFHSVFSKTGSWQRIEYGINSNSYQMVYGKEAFLSCFVTDDRVTSIRLLVK